jgi:hypothetical protein
MAVLFYGRKAWAEGGKVKMFTYPGPHISSCRQHISIIEEMKRNPPLSVLLGNEMGKARQA